MRQEEHRTRALCALLAAVALGLGCEKDPSTDPVVRNARETVSAAGRTVEAAGAAVQQAAHEVAADTRPAAERVAEDARQAARTIERGAADLVDAGREAVRTDDVSTHAPRARHRRAYDPAR